MFFEGAFTVLGTGTTNADGEFAIRVPDGRQIVLACRASRMIGDETEHYHWIVKIPETQSSVLLSNREAMLSGMIFRR